MQKFYIPISLLLLLALVVNYRSAIFPNQMETEEREEMEDEQAGIQGAIEDRLFTSSDVDLGIIPYEKLFSAIREGQKRLAQAPENRSLSASLSNAIFRERGPNNIGGRTRAILIDESDPNRNRIWIGGVSGGVWRTEDITQQDPHWIKIGADFASLSIGGIAQDPNDHKTIYVGTGESYTGDFQGVGIFKTTDDGISWTLLPSTRNSLFQYVNEIYVDKDSYVFAATKTGGLFRSKDGGEIWEKVLGISLSGASNNNFHDVFFNETSQTYFASNDNSVFKSPTGNRGGWTSVGTGKPGFPTNLTRTEFAVCPSDPNVMYVIGSIGGTASKTFISNDGGQNWFSRNSPGFDDFTNGQAWYDLEIAVDPLNCGRIFAGGVEMYVSDFQGVSWSRVENVNDGTEFHPDQHNVTFDVKKPGRVYFSNDGGIWMSENSGNVLINKNPGYVTTQFYCAAMHPDKGSSYLIGGTQDNRSLQMTEPGLSSGRIVWQGDGMFCFIDQNEPDIQIVSSQNGNYGISFDGGAQFFSGTSVDGSFVNRSGYDDDANILYGQINSGGFFRWKINNGATDFVDVTGQGISNVNVSAVKADPFVPNRIYFGSASGRVIRVDNANVGNPVTGTVIADLPGTASVSSFYMDKQTPNDMLISLFNYGGTLENIWISNNAGAEWTSIEGDLPDIPVRWAIFDPANHDRVMIATDAGIWTTDDVNGDLTHWDPTSPDNGMPFVRVDMLLIRDSDKMVLAATHGRGLMTTSVFSAATPVILSKTIAYEGQPLMIDGSQSVNAQSYDWNLGDNTTSTDETIFHTYTEPGSYLISLTVNGVITETKSITILPYLPAPYETGVSDYAGDFESHPEHFAANLVQGTSFQNGVSTKPGKDGTHSGATAWVLGINDNLYENNTRSELYTPMYDMSEPGLYELKFWSKFAIENRIDGFQVEYSTDAGESWQQLGSNEDPQWYNYHNANIGNGAFPVGKSYFTNAQLNWTQYIKDISFLSGQSKVSFRYVFRSDNEEQAQGLVIDDFEVSKYEGELKTNVTIFNASYTGDQEVTINWTTGIEYQCQKFILERSYTGIGFSEISEVNASGGVTTIAQNYSMVDQNLHDLIYYRMKVINDNPAIDYHYEFYTEPVVLQRDLEENMVHSVLTNPFTDRIDISFTSIIDQQVIFRLFDISGRLVKYEEAIPYGVSYSLDDFRQSLPPGIYVLNIQIGEADSKSYKLFTPGI